MLIVIVVNKEHVFRLQSLRLEKTQSEKGCIQSQLLLLNTLRAVLLHLVQLKAYLNTLNTDHYILNKKNHQQNNQSNSCIHYFI